MSAWIVDKVHIDVIVATLANGTRDGILPPCGSAKSNPDDIGQLLLTECVNSVAYRYPNDAPGELPGPSDAYYLNPYAFTDPHYAATAAEMAKAIDCLEYQSCEHPGWKTSQAKSLCDGIRDVIMGGCPAYARMKAESRGARQTWQEWEEAPWGFDEESLAKCKAKRASLCESLGVAPDAPDYALRDLLSERGVSEGEMRAADEKAQTAARREREREEHIAANPHLTRRTDKPNWNPGRLSAANIRRDLKRAFPNVSFSVRSDYNSVNIYWTCGPTTKQVDAVVQKYKRGSFNGMEDIYETDPDATFADVFGGVSYVFTSRELPDDGLEACRKWLAEFYDTPYVGRQTFIKALNGYVDELVYRILQDHPMPNGLAGLEQAETEGLFTLAAHYRPVGAA